MSVDDRVRVALGRSGASFLPAPAGVEAAITTARRRRARRRVGAAAAVVLAMVVGVGAVIDRQSRDAVGPTVPAASASPTPSRSTADRAADRRLADDLRGTWSTDVVSPGSANAAMTRTGTAAYRDEVLKVLRLPGRITLVFDDLAYRAELNGDAVDEGTWSVDGGKLVLAPYCTTSCRTVLGPTLHDGTLTLILLEDSSPDVDRVPDAAHATVIYGAAPFHRPRRAG